MDEREDTSVSTPLKIEDLNEGMIMDIKRKLGKEVAGLISLPLFRVTGTPMDIEQLYEQLQENNQALGGKVTHQPKPSFETQWKIRMG